MYPASRQIVVQGESPSRTFTSSCHATLYTGFRSPKENTDACGYLNSGIWTVEVPFARSLLCFFLVEMPHLGCTGRHEYYKPKKLWARKESIGQFPRTSQSNNIPLNVTYAESFANPGFLSIRVSDDTRQELLVYNRSIYLCTAQRTLQGFQLQFGIPTNRLLDRIWTLVRSIILQTLPVNMRGPRN